MLITHVKPNDLLGKKVYGKDGRLVGQVVGITGRHGVVRGVLVRDEGNVVRLPAKSEPHLRVLR